MDNLITNDILVMDSGDSKRSIDELTGFMTIKDCILAGVGALPYPKKTIFADSADDDSTVYVLRDEESYSDDFVTGANGKDITFTHQFVDSKDANKKSVGVVINPVFDGSQFKADLLIKDQQTIDELEKPENKDKYSLSVGIYSKLQDHNDTVDGHEVVAKQVELKFNHVAIVTNPRYKQARISDQDDTQTGTPQEPTATTEEPTTEQPTGTPQFTDDIEAEIERRATERAIKLADERVKVLSKAVKVFADYDGTSKTGKQVMIDIINAACSKDHFENWRIKTVYSACFGDIPADLLSDEALNIMFNVVITLATDAAVKLQPTEITVVTPNEGVQVTVTQTEDSDTNKKTALSMVQTTDSTTDYTSPRDQMIKNMKGYFNG